MRLISVATCRRPLSTAGIRNIPQRSAARNEGVTKHTDGLIVDELGWPLLDDGRPSNSLARAKSYRGLIASDHGPCTQTQLIGEQCRAKQSSFRFPIPRQIPATGKSDFSPLVRKFSPVRSCPNVHPFRHRRSERGAPNMTSAMRARVPGVVFSGRASREKKPCAAISRLGTGTRCLAEGAYDK